MEKNSAQAYKDFLKTFEQLAYRHSYADTFSNFLDFSLYMLSPLKACNELEAIERMGKTYTTEQESKLMAELFNNFTIAADSDGNGFHDCLGDLFMDLISHGRNGQFFTPQPICDMMAQLTYGNDLQPGKSVCDPACGSGRTLLAVAKMERNLKFYGADNDITCCKMAVLNMIVNTMEGEIAWMNSLTMEHYRSWHIKKILVGTHYMPYVFTTDKNQTHFIERLTKAQEDSQSDSPKEIIVGSEASQLSLFDLITEKQAS